MNKFLAMVLCLAMPITGTKSHTTEGRYPMLKREVI